MDDILTSSASKIDGIVATNTTTSRPTSTPQTEKIFSEDGGLSGAPLNEKSTELIRHIFNKTEGNLPIIGVGGIMNSNDAWNKITAGASLLQLYTGLIFEGPGITNEIVTGLRSKIKEKGLTKKGYGPKKISLEKIHEVRKLYSEGKHTQEELANIYGISQSFVSKIVNKISRKIYHDISLTSNSKIRVGYKHGH